MNQPTILLKVTVVASSLLLVSGLVFYRAGAFNGIMESSAVVQAAIIPDTVNTPPDTSNTQTTSDTGSFAKRFRILTRDTLRDFPPDTNLYELYFDSASSANGGAAMVYRRKRITGQKQPDTTRRPEYFMGGSKSLAPLIEPSSSDSQKSTSPDTSNPPKK